MAYKKPTLFTIRVITTSGETLEHELSARDIGLLLNSLREKSFIKFGPYYLNRINISYIHFPYECLLGDGIYTLDYDPSKDWESWFDEMEKFDQKYKYWDTKPEEFSGDL